MNVFIIIPACNEEQHIADVITAAKQYCSNIIVVDDGSIDETFYISSQLTKTLRLPVNMGKGYALRLGCDYAIKNGADIIVAIDSDGQHQAEDIPRFLNELKDNDIVFGYRQKGRMPSVLKLGNKGLSWIGKIRYGINLQDSQCGFRAFTKKAYEKIRWNSNDYTVESEMMALTGKHKLKYKELGIQTIYNDKYKGTTVVNGLKIGLDMLFKKF